MSFRLHTNAFLTWAVILLVPASCLSEPVNELPPGADRAPAPLTHFPDALHAVVWRNWGLVKIEHLARVLGATVENVRELATSMGLPRSVPMPPEMLRRGYITLIRRNWHLLPYQQLTDLLGMTPETLAFTLREDDFLYQKLGPKPKCDPVKYQDPSPDARRRAAEIKHVVERYFGQQLTGPAEPRFAFVAALSKLPSSEISKSRPEIRIASNSPRFVYSYFALYGDPLSDPELDPYPEGLLARLKEIGVNGVWLHVVLRQLAPGEPNFPEWGKNHERRIANLQKLVQRARRYGIDVYLYLNEPRAMPKEFFQQRPEMAGVQEGNYRALCTSNPIVRRWLTDSLAYVFHEVPDLGGIFTITASENLTNCASHGHEDGCPRCKHRSDAEIIAEVNAAMERGVHRSAPNAKVIVWDWGWKNHGDAADIIAKLPSPTWLMSVSEWGLPIERGGFRTQVGEYSISALGPGSRATRHWQLAKDRELKTIAKVQLNNSWELSSVPYLPVMDLVAEHCSRLAHTKVDGMMLSWSLGGYPSPNLELAQNFAGSPVPSVDSALNEIAVRHFGKTAAPLVRRAWTTFSHAFQEFPYSGAVLYNGPQQMGPANLLYARSTGYSATMVGLPYDDLEHWRGPYSADTFAAQFERLADGWAAGLVDLMAAQRLVPNELQNGARADLRVAQAAQLHFASSANQAKFVLARNRLLSSTNQAEKDRLRAELLKLVDREIDSARGLFDLTIADSRIGYEASNQYYYVPLDLVEKVVNCVQLRSAYDAAIDVQ